MLLVILAFQASVLAISSIKNYYLMLSVMLICKDCEIIPGTMQEFIILAVLPAFFVNTEPANKTFPNPVETDRCT